MLVFVQALHSFPELFGVSRIEGIEVDSSSMPQLSQCSVASKLVVTEVSSSFGLLK